MFVESQSIENPFAELALCSELDANVEIDISSYSPFDSNSSKQEGPEVQQELSAAELQKRQDELERREEELARRERTMRANFNNARRNNWPPLPDPCCLQPCFYQNIQVDIPMEFQSIVFNLYHLWLLHSTVLILNIIGGMILGNLKLVASGILLTTFLVPTSYICWFRPVYNAFRSDSSYNFMLFFLFFSIHFIITSIQAIGFRSSGTIGLLTTFDQFEDTSIGLTKKLICLFITGCFGCTATADLILLMRIHGMYKTTGASIAKAQAEFTSDFLHRSGVFNSNRY